jgi:hypothetical protein
MRWFFLTVLLTLGCCVSVDSDSSESSTDDESYETDTTVNVGVGFGSNHDDHDRCNVEKQIVHVIDEAGNKHYFELPIECEQQFIPTIDEGPFESFDNAYIEKQNQK